MTVNIESTRSARNSAGKTTTDFEGLQIWRFVLERLKGAKLVVDNAVDDVVPDVRVFKPWVLFLMGSTLLALW